MWFFVAKNLPQLSRINGQVRPEVTPRGSVGQKKKMSPTVWCCLHSCVNSTRAAAPVLCTVEVDVCFWETLFQLHLSENHSRITTWKKTGRKNRERVGIAISSSYIRIWDKTLFLYCSNGQLPAPKPNLGPPNHPIRPAIGVRNKYQTTKSRENSLISVSVPLTD